MLKTLKMRILTPLVFFSLFASSACFATSECVLLLQDQIALSNVATDSQLLPEKIDIVSNKNNSEKLFSLANELWQEEAKLTEVREVVAQLARGELSVLNKKTKADLKTSRKYGLIIRSGFQLFDKSHAMPEEIQNFIRAFGKLNDAISSKHQAKIIARAQSLLELFEKLPSQDLLEYFTSAGKGNFIEYMENHINEISVSISKSAVSEKEFHATRKSIRTLLAYFQLQYATQPSRSKELICNYLAYISREMGNIHDEIVESKINKSKNFEDVRIPGFLKDRIRSFIDRVR